MEQSLNMENNSKKPMKQIVRAGIGFVGGILFFLGMFLLAQTGKFYDILPNPIMGMILMAIGIGFFFYAWNG